MHWKLFANLAETTGEREIAVDAEPGDTLRMSFNGLLDSYPALRDDLLTEDGELQEHIRLLRNGSDPFAADGFDTVLEDGDELALFPPVSGG